MLERVLILPPISHSIRANTQTGDSVEGQGPANAEQVEDNAVFLTKGRPLKAEAISKYVLHRSRLPTLLTDYSDNVLRGRRLQIDGFPHPKLCFVIQSLTHTQNFCHIPEAS